MDASTLSTKEIILQYVCPTLGAIMASFFFAAPVKDLRIALLNGNIGHLNTFPFPYVCGNCLGWTVYGYYVRDPFVVAANIPGLLLSIWLNCGASKLQYLALYESKQRRMNNNNNNNNTDNYVWDASRPIEDSYTDDHEVTTIMYNESQIKEQDDMLILVPQEIALFRIIIIWCIVIIYVGWFTTSYHPATIVGIIVNINLIVLYGAPLQTMHSVITTQNSISIHTLTMIMNILNTTFWMSYGLAQWDIMIIIPNTIGLILGLIQCTLKMIYPSTTMTGGGNNNTMMDMLPIPNHDPNDNQS